MIPYKAPVKVHVFNRRWVLRDPQNREIVELMLNSNSIDYWKKMTLLAQLIADLMNGKKSIQYKSGEYSIQDHLNVPEPAKAQIVPGSIAGAEQMQAERIIAESKLQDVTIAPEIEKAEVEPKKKHKKK